MKTNRNKTLYLVTFLIIILSIVTSLTGVVYTTGGQPYNFTNLYGDTVKINGDGLYAYDSYFMAPIFKGTDFTTLFVTVPLLIFALIVDSKKNTMKTRIFLTSMIALVLYYATSIAFGVTYNILHLVYIALFSASLFGLIISIMGLDRKKIADSVDEKSLPFKGMYIFLFITGVALTVAWLPDIISALIAGRSLQLIEIYTTAITYVLDIGIITPLAFICLNQLKNRKGMGYILAGILFTVCMLVGIMLPIQTVFQTLAGIEIPLPALITKVFSFVILAIFAIYFNIKLFKSIKE